MFMEKYSAAVLLPFRNSGIMLLLGDSSNCMPLILVSSSTKRVATQILVIAKLSRRKEFTLRGFACDVNCPSNKLPV